MPTDQTTRRLERLENKISARGELIDISDALAVIDQVYGTEPTPGRVRVPETAWDEFTRVLLIVYGPK